MITTTSLKHYKKLKAQGSNVQLVARISPDHVRVTLGGQQTSPDIFTWK
jgi:hypothetical protein